MGAARLVHASPLCPQGRVARYWDCPGTGRAPHRVSRTSKRPHCDRCCSDLAREVSLWTPRVQAVRSQPWCPLGAAHWPLATAQGAGQWGPGLNILKPVLLATAPKAPHPLPCWGLPGVRHPEAQAA